MSDPSDYLRQPSTTSGELNEVDLQVFVDPYLQPVEGGYYKCTLCDAMLPGPHHVTMHIEGKVHRKRMANAPAANSEPTCPGYFEQYGRQFFEGDIELNFGVIGADQAPAHFDDDMRCELCETSTYGWDQWHTHFIGKKHMKARRNSTNRMMWQRLDAQYPYYYEHLTGVWQTTPPKHGHTTKDGLLVVVPPHTSS